MKKETDFLKNQLEKREEFWRNAWIGVASSTNCSNSEVPSRWANLALEQYDRMFYDSIDNITQLSLRDSEIIDLKDEISKLKILICDLEEEINAWRINNFKFDDDLSKP